VTRILMFDSGVGGLSVFDAICAAGLPLEIDYAADTAWLPYGAKAPADLRERVPAILARLYAQLEPNLIVIACNTASTIALDAARAAVPVPIVGVVPPIKPAAEMTGSGVIGLLATPATAAGAYVDDLIARFAADKTVIRFGSTRLVAAAEAALAGAPIDRGAIEEAVAGLFAAPGGAAIDVVALACTHFPLLKDELAGAGPAGCAWLDSGAAIARRVAALLATAPGAGQARPHRALFTAVDRAPLDAFSLRGFSAFGRVGPAPHFEAAPHAVVGAA
jgi:glutamate racemase